MNSNRRLHNSSSSQHYIESGITMHQASLEAWVEATLVRSGKLNDGPSPWETQNPVPDFPSVRILIQEPRWYILTSLWCQLGLCGGSLNEDFGWDSFHFNAVLLVDSGIKVIKEDQTEFLTIKEPGGIIKCHSMLCSLKIRWDVANSLPALVYNNSHSIRWLDLRSQIFKVQSHLKWLRLRLGGGTHRDRLADHLCLDIVIIVTQPKTQNTK